MLLKVGKYIISILLGLGSGAVIAGAVFAFIAIIGVVPRLAQKTGTTKNILLFEECIIIGGIFGTLTMVVDFSIPLNKFFVAFLSLCNGVFVGCLAMSLAEVLDVMPILFRRLEIPHGAMSYFIFAIAIGKLVGSLLYFIVPGFYEY